MNNTHTDVFGNVLNIGDMVACTCWEGKKTNSSLQLAFVVGFTDKKIRLSIAPNNPVKPFTKFSNQVCKRFEVNIFRDSQDYLYNNLGMTDEDAKAIAKYIYEEEISRMDY